jgi:hypothetical protein
MAVSVPDSIVSGTPLFEIGFGVGGGNGEMAVLITTALICRDSERLVVVWAKVFKGTKKEASITAHKH